MISYDGLFEALTDQVELVNTDGFYSMPESFILSPSGANKEAGEIIKILAGPDEMERALLTAASWIREHPEFTIFATDHKETTQLPRHVLLVLFLASKPIGTFAMIYNELTGAIYDSVDEPHTGAALSVKMAYLLAMDIQASISVPCVCGHCQKRVDYDGTTPIDGVKTVVLCNHCTQFCFFDGNRTLEPATNRKLRRLYSGNPKLLARLMKVQKMAQQGHRND